jgi:hypothetical protein
MSSQKFKFVSPGIFINEIDKSQTTEQGTPPGPVIIGRFERGPGMRPVRVNSFSEFVQIFGNPIAGKGGVKDVWREGNYMAPTYAAYAAQAYLANQAPATIIRLLGQESDNPTTFAAGTASTYNSKAGWGLNAMLGAANTVTQGSPGGAYGLFVYPSASTGQTEKGADSSPTQLTMSLAAVFYTTGNDIVALSGTLTGPGTINAVEIPQTATASQACLIDANTVSGRREFTVALGTLQEVHDGGAERVAFNFDRNSEKFIRSVFNTNPVLANTDIVASANSKAIWLGETYEKSLLNYERTGMSALTDISGAVVLGLSAVDGSEWGNRQAQAKTSKTGWFISQHFGEPENFNPTKVQKLFKLHSLEKGAWAQRNLKISIENIKPSPSLRGEYGSFTVAIRKINDKDSTVQYVEKFTNCNLNPNSPNYLARRIGDKTFTWVESDRALRTEGTYDNVSKYVRVEMHPTVEMNGHDSRCVPFGVFGPYRLKNIGLLSSSMQLNRTEEIPATLIDGANLTTLNGERTYRPFGLNIGMSSSAVAGNTAMVKGALNVAQVNHVGDDRAIKTHTDDAGSSPSTSGPTGFFVDAVTAQDTTYHRHGFYTGAIRWPELPLRKYADAPIRFTRPQDCYWGVDMYESGSDIFDPSVLDVTRMMPNGWDEDDSTYTEPSWVFSLDDLRASNERGAVYLSGSRNSAKLILEDLDTAEGSNYAAVGKTGFELGSITALSGANALLTGSSFGFNKFTTLMHGGFDGLDVTEKDPFRNTKLALPTAGATDDNNAMFYTVKRAIDTMADTDIVDCNLVTVPGLTNSTLTDHLVKVAEERADTLAIIDIENDFVPEAESTDNAATRRPAVDTAVFNLHQRGIDSSYGACYYPFVTIRDNLNDHLVDVPASVVALGTLAYSEAVRDVWFAPAGFTRGGLSRGTSGLQVVGVKHHLSSAERDKLYERNINPIASFPAEGVVVFGQKTLQMTPSALDRINVRRLLIRLKRDVSRIASTILFEQNVLDTWTKFVSQVTTLLNDVKGGQGLEDFKVVLDETTTTPELVDRNILYAKIFLKPARAIEFIALDFIITDSGASFDD